MKKIIALLVELLVIFTSCAERRSIDDMLEASSDRNIKDVINTIYSRSQLEDISNFNGDIYQYDKKYPIDCLRRDPNCLRVVYCGDLYLAIIRFDGAGVKQIGEVVKTNKLKTDFSNIERGDTLESVKQIDPDGQYLFLDTGRNDYPKLSTHYTIDGYLITIEYDTSHTVLGIETTLI